MNRSHCRQVLDCGDGVFGVTALVFAALKTPKLATASATSAESGDSEDPVAALQDARARTCHFGDSGNSRLLKSGFHLGACLAPPFALIQHPTSSILRSLLPARTAAAPPHDSA
ncbi:MAG: hypothetical protein HYY24_14985 [Verrucomicrobia bacterium]|nr:hypothetical protein [Verrucomicrobiota bacterium]